MPQAESSPFWPPETTGVEAKGEEKEQESAGRKEEGHRKEQMRQEEQRGWGGRWRGWDSGCQD